MKTSELTGTALDWAVAKCEGLECTEDMGLLVVEGADGYYVPSMKWAQGGPIIERECIELHCWSMHSVPWGAWIDEEHHQHGTTPLIAAMRCYVASKLGDEIEIPEELT